MTETIHIIGAGMAGAEAAWQAAQAGARVVLHEMRPHTGTEAHRTGDCAELVCSNSFRSDDAATNAVGLLHAEMRRAGSLIMAMADRHKLPAGGALAVDRDAFSAAVTAALRAHPRIAFEAGEVAALPPPDWKNVIVATGPLTSPALAQAIRAATGEDALAFFDAIAPIVHFDSIDLEKAWFQSRYDKGETEADRTAYLNCAMDAGQYNAFIDAILAAPVSDFKDWEKDTPYFEGCLPIEVMAARGRETLRHGPMKPVGLTNPHNPTVKAHAIAQLRRDNALGTLYNIVGFQTKMKYAAQADVLRLIPGLENARFARLGGIHRNTFLNSPRLLDGLLRLKSEPRLRFAGQITGVEGYVESAAMGLLAGRFASAEALGRAPCPPPPETAHGALLAHVTGGAEAATFQPMNVNFGLFPPIETRAKGRKAARKQARAGAMSERALAACDAWLARAARDRFAWSYLRARPAPARDPMARLRAIMARLRDPEGGCPWDIAQDFATIAPYTIEEAYEVADAIARGDMGDLADELGDLLLQVVYHAQMAGERGAFGFDDVARAICDKMIRRHPHVFGSERDGRSAAQQTAAWEAIKAEERGAKAQALSALDGVAVALPGLTRALKLQNRAARVGFDWPDVGGVVDKIVEEARELAHEAAQGAPDPDRVEDEYADLMFTLVNLGRWLKLDPEAAMRRVNAKFERRFRSIEAALAAQGLKPAEATLAQMEALWTAAKQDERR